MRASDAIGSVLDLSTPMLYHICINHWRKKRTSLFWLGGPDLQRTALSEGDDNCILHLELEVKILGAKQYSINI